MPSSKPEVIVVTGPTATGKTVIGAAVAKALQSEVISVDSQQVYQDMDIGVARPTPEEMHGVPHHMIGVVSPAEEFSAGQYAEMARPILERLLSEGKVPVLVGGTGFYLRALLQPEHLPHVQIDPEIRAALKERVKIDGLDSLYRELRWRDPERAEQIHPHDEVRIIRALEIIYITGNPVPRTPQELAYSTLAAGLTFANRQRHIKAIHDRLLCMMDAGFLEEVRGLYEKYGFCPAMQKAHGYPELVQVIHGQRTLDNALIQIEINIRQYSKRQMTWFRKFPGIRWYAVDEAVKDEVITDVVKQYS
jgi:tRNA dimethylallyltransferase